LAVGHAARLRRRLDRAAGCELAVDRAHEQAGRTLAALPEGLDRSGSQAVTDVALVGAVDRYCARARDRLEHAARHVHLPALVAHHADEERRFVALRAREPLDQRRRREPDEELGLDRGTEPGERSARGVELRLVEGRDAGDNQQPPQPRLQREREPGRAGEVDL
jgi:hypothetical protein